MQKIKLFMLAAGFLAASFVVQGQSQPPRAFPPSLMAPPRPFDYSWQRAPLVFKAPPVPGSARLPGDRKGLRDRSPLLPIAKGRLLVMRPDNMPCLVPDPAGVEHMPVRRMRNINPRDSMPNKLPVIPRMPGPDIQMVPPILHT